MNSSADLKVELQCEGIRLPLDEKGRRGGAGPAAGKSLIFGKTVANVPTQGWFVKDSPYNIIFNNDNYWIHKDGKKLTKVIFPKTPHFYSLKTHDGTPMKKIALLHGASCLASTVCQKCVYFGTKDVCTFCGIELSLKFGDTIEEKSPEQLAEVAFEAKKEGIVNHVTLTSGTQGGKDKGLEKQLRAASAIKDKTDLPVQIQIEPMDDLSCLEDLPSWGVDTIGIHIESLDDEVLKKHAPIKAKIGFRKFLEAWSKATEVLGENQVESFIIAGLGEDPKSMFERMREMVNSGAYPFIVPLRPIPGTPLGDKRPPRADYMVPLLKRASDILKDSGLTWKKNKAGCLRCRACSALPDFEK